MQRAVLFFLAVAVLLFLAYSAKPRVGEGFRTFANFEITSKNAGTPPNCDSQLTVKQPKTVDLAQAGVGNIEPTPPPAPLPSAPVGGRSQETPQPYRNPSSEPAKYIRILRAKEELQAFFGFEVGNFANTNDPSVQIPLTRARADLAELVDIQSVLERNPGLPARITCKQLEDINANLRYLRAIQRQWETSGAIKEGFDGAFQTTEEGFADMMDEKNYGPPATEKQLSDFLTKLKVEITRLQASGTSDPVIKARIDNLERIQADVQTTLDQLHEGAITPDTVPIYASDLEKALPLLGNPNDPLPTILKTTGLPPAVQNLLPGGGSPKDVTQISQITNVASQYLSKIFNNTAWKVNIGLGYDSRAPAPGQDVAADKPVIQIGTPATLDAAQPLNLGLPGAMGEDGPQPTESTEVTPAFAGTRQMMKTSFGMGLPGTTTQEADFQPEVHLNWQERSKQITQQIKKQGYDPKIFGAMDDNTEVSPEFSWRGYTMMLCSRVKAVTDPGFGITVGCPPDDFSGWRS